MASDDIHAKAMDSLCFVCTSLIKKVSGYYYVKDELELLRRTLRCPQLFELSGITPTKLCSNCYRALLHVDCGETVKTSKVMPEWYECSSNCNSCNILLRSEKKHLGRKKKVCALNYFPQIFFRVIIVLEICDF